MIANFFAPLAMKIAGGLVAILLVGLGITYIALQRADRRADEAERALATAEAEITLLKHDSALRDTAANERQADTTAAREAREELIDAISEIPDERPGPVRVAFGCQRLRNAGYAESDLPAECRPTS